MKKLILLALLFVSISSYADLKVYTTKNYTFKKGGYITFTTTKYNYLSNKTFRIIKIQLQGVGKYKKAVAWINTEVGCVGIELEKAINKNMLCKN